MSIRRELEKRPISYQQGTIVTSVQLSPRVKRLTIRPEEPFDWIPGQFIITKTHVDGEDVIADYTIISSVQNIETWDILVDNYPGSRVGQRMHDAKIGDEFTFKAPRGRFYLEADTDPDGIVFVFRDIGIAAAIPLLRELYELQSSAKIDIFNVMTSG
ncbi:MAG: ferredoxin--NADP reductase, partial [Candidatus Kariarchaeaceae archaeon]